MKKKIFLSGPMRGMSRSHSLAWRKLATELLQEDFDVVHAMRGRELKEAFEDSRSAVIRDLNDIKSADIILVNDTVKDCSMIGTSMEVFYAYEQFKPVIVFGEAHKEDYWLNYCIHLRVGNLEKACHVLKSMFIN